MVRSVAGASETESTSTQPHVARSVAGASETESASTQPHVARSVAGASEVESTSTQPHVARVAASDASQTVNGAACFIAQLQKANSCKVFRELYVERISEFEEDNTGFVVVHEFSFNTKTKDSERIQLAAFPFFCIYRHSGLKNFSLLGGPSYNDGNSFLCAVIATLRAKWTKNKWNNCGVELKDLRRLMVHQILQFPTAAEGGGAEAMKYFKEDHCLLDSSPTWELFTDHYSKMFDLSVKVDRLGMKVIAEMLKINLTVFMVPDGSVVYEGAISCPLELVCEFKKSPTQSSDDEVLVVMSGGFSSYSVVSNDECFLSCD